MFRTLTTSTFAGALLLLMSAASGCSTVGDFCRNSGECASGEFCCTEGKCDNGMCTLSCSDDRDCPTDMACRDDKFCLFLCDTDRDCAPGFECKEKDGKNMCTG